MKRSSSIHTLRESAPPERPYLAALAIVSGVPAEFTDWRRSQEAK
jgi:hypothetical protein